MWYLPFCTKTPSENVRFYWTNPDFSIKTADVQHTYCHDHPRPWLSAWPPRCFWWLARAPWVWPRPRPSWSPPVWPRGVGCWWRAPKPWNSRRRREPLWWSPGRGWWSGGRRSSTETHGVICWQEIIIKLSVIDIYWWLGYLFIDVIVVIVVIVVRMIVMITVWSLNASSRDHGVWSRAKCERLLWDKNVRTIENRTAGLRNILTPTLKKETCFGIINRPRVISGVETTTGINIASKQFSGCVIFLLFVLQEHFFSILLIN